MNSKSNIEARKLSILEYLAELEDENIIQQIENLLKPGTDFWDDLTENQKNVLFKGIKELDNNKRVDYKSFLTNLRKKS